MADTKVSALTAATVFNLADEFPKNEAGVSKKITGTILSQNFPWLIATQSGALATYQFSSIAATWRELELRYYLRDTTATNAVTNALLTINADAAANYYVEQLQIHGTTTTVPAESIATTGINLLCVGGGSTANLHASGTAGIAGYKGAGLKNVVIDVFVPTAITTGNLNRYVSAGVWNNTAAIISLTITPTTGFDANSYCELWGYGS